MWVTGVQTCALPIYGIGIRYSAADLGVAYANESVGAMDVPVFYQPPRSSNVTVLMHAVFEESNVSRLVVSELSAQRKLVEIRIAGRIDATTHIMNFPLPKIQVQTPCFHLQNIFGNMFHFKKFNSSEIQSV